MADGSTFAPSQYSHDVAAQMRAARIRAGVFERLSGDRWTPWPTLRLDRHDEPVTRTPLTSAP